MSDLVTDKSELIDPPSGDDEVLKLKEQLSSSSSEARLVNEVNKVLLSDDFTYFTELADKDPTQANKVVERIAKQRGLDVEETRNLLTKKEASPTVDVEKAVQDTIEKREGKKALDDFISEMQLDKDPELKEEFISNFNDYMEGKKFTTVNVKKFTKSAYRDLNEDKVKSFEKKKGDIEAQISAGKGGKDKGVKEKSTLFASRKVSDW